MIEVGILYSDLTPVWKPIADKDDFVKTGVLTLSVTSERGNRQALLARMWSWQNNEAVTPQDSPWWGEDNYLIGTMPNNTFFTYQWADNDENLVTRSTVDGTVDGSISLSRAFPPQANITVFRGAYLEPADWLVALAKFEAEMF